MMTFVKYLGLMGRSKRYRFPNLEFHICIYAFSIIFIFQECSIAFFFFCLAMKSDFSSQIRETPHKRHHKFIEFYDVRAAEAALRALNRSDIAGKRIKLEPSRPGGARRK